MIRIINQHKEEPKVYKVNCDCGCKFECEKSDMHEGIYGDWYVECPVCGSAVYIEEVGSTKLDETNIQFPKHFYHFAECERAVNISSELIQKWVRELAKKNKTAEVGDFAFTASGNTIVAVVKFEDEDKYIVAKDYWELEIPHYEEDLWETANPFDMED